MVCKRYHALRFCERFLRMSVKERNRAVRKYRYCDNCLARSHDLRSCTSMGLCRKCDSYHHTLLHPSRVKNDLRRQLNRQPTNRPANNNTINNRQVTTNKSNGRSSNNNRQPTTNRNKPAVPDQQILSEAIRSLAQVLCATPK